MAEGEPRTKADRLLEKTAEPASAAQLLITSALDVKGCTRMAHKLQSRITTSDYGFAVPVHMEYLKHSAWESIRTAQGLSSDGRMSPRSPRGDDRVCSPSRPQSPPASVVREDMAAGLRTHPYSRRIFPSIEVLLLRQLGPDVEGAELPVYDRADCLLSIDAPSAPSDTDLDTALERLGEHFARRTLRVTLQAKSCILPDEDGKVEPSEEGQTFDVAGVDVEVQAFHPRGFARFRKVDSPRSAPEPLRFRGTTDADGVVELRILPAQVNKVVVPESSRFHAHEKTVHLEELWALKDGPTLLPLDVTAKNASELVVVLVNAPERPPDQHDQWYDTWVDAEPAAYERGVCSVTATSTGGALQLEEEPAGTFRGCAPEGFVELECIAPERTVTRPLFLLRGSNRFLVPMGEPMAT